MINIEDLEKEAIEALRKSKGIEEIEEVRVKYLGRKGLLTNLLRSLKDLPVEERRRVGKLANDLRKNLEKEIEEKKKGLVRVEKKSYPLDISLPGWKRDTGSLHPLTRISREMEEIFRELGFSYVEGPEIETEYYNFDALNHPPAHPARDVHDTFYLAKNILLRSHTSPVQIHILEKEKPPLRIITAGRCFRRDALDASHSPVFYQMEGLLIDKKINFGHLKGILTTFLQRLFGNEIKVMFTPAFFPFTEPSAEVSISCIFCKGSGCSTCGHSGWLEILGAGMVDPRVLRPLNYDPEEWGGFAFGMGIDRIAMLKYRISDVRLFYENDLRFLNQFK